MGDAMVTARMPQAKKEAGNRVLSQIGCSTSQFINSAYDYLIQHGASPFNEEKGGARATRESIAEALERVEAMCLPASNRFATMSDDEIRRERLARQGGESR
ncbi:MAG: RelB/DinJ family addiction module antitoxin [Eggerthellaceae bacterium]|nr:RelB/DinJ family addiction module antitoxin [Eggerthellaceae bacterium]